jgi:photosystem II stability/assembly factor-like uncharacterized protein
VRLRSKAPSKKSRLINAALAGVFVLAPVALGTPRLSAQSLASVEGNAGPLANGGRGSFDPSLLERVGRTSAVMVLGTNYCGKHLCPQLWEVGDRGRAVTRLAPPPGTTATYPGLVEGAGDLVFANATDGYALGSIGSGTNSYFTSNGARSWAPLPASLARSLNDVVASDGTFYGLISECTTTNGLEYCSDRLGRSPARAPDWSSVAIPGAERLLAGYISLAVQDDEVWIYLYPLKAGTAPDIVSSADGLPPFSERPEPELVSVTTCSIALMTTTAAWVSCPTGMMVSWWRTTDGGHRYTSWWETAGTGGDAFDPLTTTIAYRYTGDVGPGPPHALELTTDGGTHFVAVAHLPFNGGSQVELAFVDEEDGFVLGRGEGGHSLVLFTSDGGRAWQVVFGPQTTRPR